MSDFVIKKKDGTEFGVDDLAINEGGAIGKYIERYTHEIKTITLSEVSGMRCERWGWQGGPAFTDKQKGSWKRPV
jgi:hypothetical protein